MVSVFWRENEWQPAFGEALNNLEVQESQLRTKTNLSEIYYCNEIASSAFRLG